MVNIEKVSHQILNDALYNTLLFEIQEMLSEKNITPKMIEDLLHEDSSLIDEYKEINKHSELSSIHVKLLAIEENDEEKTANLKAEINKNIQILKNLENFETDSKESAYSIWVGSVGVMVIFIAHNFIALFSELYATHAPFVYMFYALILGFTYLGYSKMKINHDNRHLIFQKIHTSTKEMLKNGFNASCFTHGEVYEK
jgi:hypothetical protein